MQSIKYLPIIFLFFLFSCQNKEEKSIMVFAGAASQPATEEAALAFEKETGIKVEVNFGGSGYVLSQMNMAKQGDIYFPGSSDFMEIAKEQEVVFPETEKIIAYLVPAINVQKGNPRNIKRLKDLNNSAYKVAIANPEGVCVGTYALEIIEKNFTNQEKDAFQKNLVNYTGSCSKTAAAISIKSVDAVMGWRVFQYWEPENIETIDLDKSEIVRIGYIPIAVSKYSKKTNDAQAFIDFILSEKGKTIFRKYNFLMSEQEAFDYIGEEKPIGGQYNVPERWLNN